MYVPNDILEINVYSLLHNTSIILQHNNAAKYQIITICQTKTLHQESYISLRRKLIVAKFEGFAISNGFSVVSKFI